ncbi:hypothetical protein L7F22_028013 [Adiantum nelumboides]|nr:hypothetical protein [Adiantum nelumboides]
MVLTRATRRDLSSCDVISTSQDSQAFLDVQFEEGEPPIPQQHQEGQSSKQGEALESSIQEGDEDVKEEVGTIIEGNFFCNWLEDHCVDKEARLPPVPISKLRINSAIRTHDDQIELLQESFIHSYGYQPSLGEFIVSESFPVFLFMFHREAEVSIPCTLLYDIFMMQCLGLAVSTSIVAKLEPELHDWALKHKKNKSQAQNWSKWVLIPTAFIAKLVWKDEFLKAYHSKTKDIPHLESLEYADLCDVYDERREKAPYEVEKTFTRRAYDYVAIANPENGQNIQPVHLPLLCDTGDIVERLYDLNNKDRFGDMDPARALHGAQLIWADFPTGTAVSCTSPLVSTWNKMRLDLIEAATTLAEEYLLDNGTFVATLQGEDLTDVVNVLWRCGLCTQGRGTMNVERLRWLRSFAVNNGSDLLGDIVSPWGQVDRPPLQGSPGE